MSYIKPPPEVGYNILSLGAGVQSSMLALMAAKGEIGPMPDCAIFADTQAEPASVYKWLDWLEKELPFPVHRVTAGNLTTEQLKPRVSKKGHAYVRQLIPFHGRKPNGDKTMVIGRKCTAEFKIRPINKLMRKLAKIKRGEKEIKATQWIGISWDEIQRMKVSREPWFQNRFPLVEKEITRAKCLEWMELNKYPEPPRSACTYCPFHDNKEWRRLRDDEPKEFAKAVQFDKDLRKMIKENDKRTQMEVFLHTSMKPIGEIDFDNDTDKGQVLFDFSSECEGMCGV